MYIYIIFLYFYFIYDYTVPSYQYNNIKMSIGSDTIVKNGANMTTSSSHVVR